MSTKSLQSQFTFTDMLKSYEQALSQRSYSHFTITYHVGILKRIYNDPINVNEQFTYSPFKSEIWLENQHTREVSGQILHSYLVFMRTVIKQFEQFCQEGRLIIKRRYERPACLPECFHCIYQEFLCSLPQNLAPATISLHETNSRQFFEYLLKHSILDLKLVGYETVKKFLADAATHHRCSMDKVIQALKLLFTFLLDRGFVVFNPDFRVMKPAYRRKPVLPHFTHDEVESLLSLIDRSSAIGKRDYAVVLVAIYTGLRSSDVFNLRLNNIDWRRHEIRITQKKTGNELCLPLSAEAGNALADYILNGRPSSAEEYVFVKCVAPYTKLNGKGAGYHILEKCYSLNEELAEKCTNKTFHSFRRSLGSWLSMEKTPLPLISEILGHTNLESSKFYLSYDNSSMSMCCLGLDGIPVLKGELA